MNDVANIYDGTHQTPTYTTTGTRFVSVENISNIYASEKYISTEDFEKEFKTRPQKGDILMTRIGTIGVPAYVYTDEPLAYYVSLALIKCKKISGRFLTQFIQSEYFQQELSKRTLHDASPKKINKGEIGHCNILVPCEEEQEKITQILETLDKKIETESSILENWKLLRKGLLQQMIP